MELGLRLACFRVTTNLSRTFSASSCFSFATTHHESSRAAPSTCCPPWRPGERNRTRTRMTHYNLPPNVKRNLSHVITLRPRSLKKPRPLQQTPRMRQILIWPRTCAQRVFDQRAGRPHQKSTRSLRAQIFSLYPSSSNSTFSCSPLP